MAEYFSFLSDWSPNELNLFQDTFAGIGAYEDPTAQAMFDNGYFNFDISSADRIAIREALSEYIYSEYGYDFDEIFDWEAWREAYGEAA